VNQQYNGMQHDATDPVQLLAGELRGHEEFAATRRRVYVEQSRTTRLLDAYIADGSDADGRAVPPLVITGESGSGKSALLAFWSNRYRQRDPGAFIIAHYVGATASSTSHLDLIRRIMLEIRERYGIADEVPSIPDRIEQEFPGWLGRVQNEQLVLLVDALNQLTVPPDERSAVDWLPRHLPPNVRLIVSTLAGPILDELSYRGWQIEAVEPLGEVERRAVIRQYLRNYETSLGSEYVGRIASGEQCANPLFLRTSLDEVRRQGNSTAAREAIEYYIASTGLDDLYQRLLARLESEHGESSVRTVLAMLWASRCGLDEDDLATLAGSTVARLRPLLASLSYHLLLDHGLYQFCHEQMRLAVTSRYQSDPQLQHQTYQRVAEYFAAQPLSGRRASEEPWQWLQAQQWERLSDCLADLGMFRLLNVPERKYDLLGYWLALGGREPMERAYRRSAAALQSEDANPETTADTLESLAEFMVLSGSFDTAEYFLLRALDLRAGSDAESLATANCRRLLGELFVLRGKYARAEEYLSTALKTQEQVLGSDTVEVSESLQALGVIFYLRQEYDQAISLFGRALGILERRLGREHPETSKCAGALGAMYMGKRDLNNAESLFRRALEYAEHNYGSNHPQTATYVNNLGALLLEQGRLDDAITYFQRALQIYERLLGPSHPHVAVTLNNLCHLLKRQGRMEEAEAGLRRAIAIHEEVLGPDHSEIVTKLNQLGHLLREVGRNSEAEQMYCRALAICLEHPGVDHPATIKQRLHVATSLSGQGLYEDALAIYRHYLPLLIDSAGLDDHELPIFTRWYIDILQALALEEEEDAILQRLKRP
jgi:tetratricopeptide (TPR) repeat protein